MSEIGMSPQRDENFVGLRNNPAQLRQSVRI